MIPISREIFWGPMAYAMMGGIIVGAALTLLFQLALYIAWLLIPAPDEKAFDVRRNTREPMGASLVTPIISR